MRADGEQPRKIVGELGDLLRSPVWSDDGKQIAFLRGVYRPGTYGIQPQIEILDPATNRRLVLPIQGRLGEALAWIEDRLIYVAVRNAAEPERFQFMVGENRSADGKAIGHSDADYFQSRRGPVS